MQNHVDPFSLSFNFRVLFTDKPMVLLGTFALVVTIATTVTVHLAEDPLDEEFESYWNCFWVTVVTISTARLSIPLAPLRRACRAHTRAARLTLSRWGTVTCIQRPTSAGP